MATGKVIIYKGIPYFSDVKVPTRVSQLANDAGYVTTDEKVKQTPNTTSLDSHPILFSASDSNGEVVGGTYKNPDFYYNPNLNRMIFKNGGGIEVRSGTASVSVLSQYILLSDLDDHSIMNVTANDIELEDVTSQGTTYNNTWDGTHHSLKDTIGSLVSKAGDTISGDYINTANFIEAGVTGKRVTTYGPWGIDVEEYVATSLWSRLSLRDSDILLTKTWDGTNTSLRQSLTAMASDTGWQTVTSSYCDIKVRKIGKVVELTIWSDKAIPASQQIATLADAYKPVISVYPNRLYLRNSISTASDITLRIENNGAIYNTGNANTKGNWVVIHAMWTSYPLPS